MPNQKSKNKNSERQLVPVYLGLTITIVLVLALGIGNLAMLNYGSAKVSEHFEPLQIALEQENWPEVAKLFKAANTDWDSQKAWWQMTIDHKEVDKIDNSFTALYADILTANSKAAVKELYILQYNLRHIPEIEAISFTNIL